MLVVSDQAEGMSFKRICSILAYGGAHSPLARGEGGGRGYFGRGLKQAIFGLGHGWIESIHNGRYSHIELFRSENGGYLYDDSGGDRSAEKEDYRRMGIVGSGTQVTIVIENSYVNISHYRTVVQTVANNIYLRDVLSRRNVELLNIQRGKETERRGPVRYREPAAITLLGPDQSGNFVYQRESYPFTLTLKRAQDEELILKGDERTNGLLVLSDSAVLDCQLFEYESQVGTEYLFGTVRCQALTDKLGQGMAIISDEREGLNTKNAFVRAFSEAVSRMIAPYVLAEQEKLKHLQRATTSGRTSHMIEHLLQRMSRAAIQDLGIVLPPMPEMETDAFEQTELPAALRFTTPFYYRKVNYLFHVALLVDHNQFPDNEFLSLDYHLSDSMRIEPAPTTVPIEKYSGLQRLEWSIVGDVVGDHGEISARIGNYSAWCEIVIAEEASGRRHGYSAHDAKRKNREITAPICSSAMSFGGSIMRWRERYTVLRNEKSSSTPQRRQCSCMSMAADIFAMRPGYCWPSFSWM
nr:ATP-binding protein [Methylomarinum sp. Ch1-1]MDP4520706.1 ATP-binding protein [Methylomarinum sp. Ch1-1]